jgi:hypothetical protein
MERSTLSILKKHGGALLLAALACAGVGADAQAAELGEASVRSFIGQPLEADIELVALAPDEQNLRVALASPDVYKGANIAMNPALNSLSMSVTRGGGRQFLHITSVRPIGADHLNLFLELTGGGRSAVRASTIWLNAAPAPLVKPAPLSLPAPAPAPTSAMPDAAGSPPKFPSAPAPVRSPVLAHKPPARVPMNCSRPELGEEAQQCIDLARKNAALSKKLVELEGKIKLLQEGVGPLPAASAALPAAPAAAAGQASAASASAPAFAPRKLKPLVKSPAAPAKPVESEQSWPLTLLAGGAALLLLLIGSGVYWWRRRKQKSADPVEPADPVEEQQAAPEVPPRAGLLSRLFGRKKSAADEFVAESMTE